MSRKFAILLMVGIVAVAVEIACLRGLFPPPATATAGADPPIEFAEPTSTEPPAPAELLWPEPNPQTALVPAPPSADCSPAETSPPGVDWPRVMEEILDAQGEDRQKAQQLAALFPSLPDENKEEAAEQLARLLPADGFDGAAQIMTEAQMPEAVLATLFSELLNRPYELQLPLLVQVARHQDHPRHSDAVGLLENHLKNHFGDDRALWEGTLTEWLGSAENR